MLKKDDLFELVQSLSVSEQRYIFAKANKKGTGDNAYFLILKELISMKDYSEESLKKKFKNHAFVKHTDVKKHFLFHWILRHLMSFHFRKYPVRNQLTEIDILIDKSLYQIAYRLVIALKKTLKSSEDYLSLMNLLERELALAKFIKAIEAKSVIEELKKCSGAYSDYQIFQSLKYKMRDRIDKYVFVRTENDFLKLKRIVSNPVMDADKVPVSIKNRFLYNLINYWFYGSSGDWNVAYSYALKNFKIVSDAANNSIDFTEELVVAHYNILVASIVTENYSMMKKGMNKLIELSEKGKMERIRIEARFCYHLVQLIYANKRGEHENINDIISSAEEFIEANISKFDKKRRNNFYFDLAKAYFIAKDFSKPFHILKNIIENTGEKENSVDFICFSKILYCITCYERNDIELMVHSARSASYFLQKNNSYFDFEKRLIRFFRNELPYIEIQSRTEQIRRFVKLKEDLQDLFKEKYGRSGMIYFNFVKWIDGKIANPLPTING